MKQNSVGVHECEWKYIGEGGKHALFESRGQGFEGKLLRIEKRLFCIVSVCSSREQAGDKEWKKKPSPLKYLEEFVAPLLFPYVDIPELVPLNWTFLEALRDVTLSEGVISPSRIKDWKPKSVGGLIMSEVTPTGMLVVDYRSVPASIVEQEIPVPKRRLCLELKPKAGYLSRSPLVHPNQRVKFTKSRFSLLQDLHQQGHVEKGWARNAGGIKRSNYDPLDLFSNDWARMNRAIECLVESPQNNLKAWYNNQALIKDSTLDWQALELVLEEITSSSRCKFDERHAEAAFGSLVASLLVPVLYHETLMQQLKTIQKLDVLDVDGAILVSDRLVELCGGSEEAAEKYISDALQLGGGNHKQICCLLSASPFHLSGEDSSVLLKLCEITKRFQEILSTFDPVLPHPYILDTFHSEARDLVSMLSTEECAFLLSNWLLSLAMCDVSIFVTFEQIHLQKGGGARRGLAMPHEAGSNAFIAGSSSEGSGIVCTIQDDGVMSPFAYRVRLIDCDQKPPQKLWGRKHNEAAFAKLQQKGTCVDKFIS